MNFKGLAGNFFVIALMSLFVSSCVYFSKSASTPMTSIADLSNQQYDTLIIFLPGMGDEANDIIENGLFAAVRSAGIPVDMIAVNAYFSYYQKGSFKQRFYHDVLVPEMDKGYKKIWLAGVSMGGYGSIFMANEYEEVVSGVVALAPWLGSEEMVSEVVAQGGLRHWDGGVSSHKVKEYEKDLWLWLKGNFNKTDRSVPLYLLYGKQDKLGFGHNVLSQILPPERVLTIEGGHRWRVWKVLWERLLQNSEFRRELTN